MESEPVFEFTSTLEASDNKLWGCHFAVPQFAAEALSMENEARRVVCTLAGGAAEWQGAMLHRGDGSLLITVNKKIRDGLGLKIGSRVAVALRRDESEFGLPLPEEFEELMKQDPDGARHFAALTAGKKRTLLYIVAQPKASDGRIFRSIAVLEHLKEMDGKIDYKRLNLRLKSKDGG